MVTVLKAVTVPRPLRYTGRSRFSAAATETGAGPAAAPPALPAGAAPVGGALSLWLRRSPTQARMASTMAAGTAARTQGRRGARVGTKAEDEVDGSSLMVAVLPPATTV